MTILPQHEGDTQVTSTTPPVFNETISRPVDHSGLSLIVRYSSSGMQIPLVAEDIIITERERETQGAKELLSGTLKP
ncbi:hypothetical protein MPTK1_6g09820 [Marchantia polymorpha subsp. ruderalis]|uniref:Uncharacterized protein n=2 Tax=Marchantia polymorpha TaxID=3197 RepID=A0AAF6BQD3_MARPO|nr:hypothetical protein MARPO_0016s0026 [Marchantia polymorpha]BBN14217.1 hypothetical protein Mp_6g09820 [Marchantia polymorpha subsp. ruderalis]|eukprot:PTQ44952.1 hypothetical protein MARPO_0016s0026 [Marchantia polymorpha]